MVNENPVVHFEMPGPDGSVLTRFYAALFGWAMNEGQLRGWPICSLLRPQAPVSLAPSARRTPLLIRPSSSTLRSTTPPTT